jgi:hypothetical protein
VPTGLDVPKKQLNFYDDKHGSNFTTQKAQQWKASGVAVGGKPLFDEVAKKGALPPNRHRICDPVPHWHNKSKSNERVRSKDSPGASYAWDLDGRRHKKPKGPKQRVIDHESAQKLQELPKITNERHNPAKFINPKDSRLKDLRNDSSVLYVQTEAPPQTTNFREVSPKNMPPMNTTSQVIEETHQTSI